MDAWNYFHIQKCKKVYEKKHLCKCIHIEGNDHEGCCRSPIFSTDVPFQALPLEECFWHFSSDQGPQESSEVLQNISLTLSLPFLLYWASLVDQMVKNLPAMQETYVLPYGGHDPYDFREDKSGGQRPSLWGHWTQLWNVLFVKTMLGICELMSSYPWTPRILPWAFLVSPHVSANGPEVAAALLPPLSGCFECYVTCPSSCVTRGGICVRW